MENAKHNENITLLNASNHFCERNETELKPMQYIQESTVKILRRPQENRTEKNSLDDVKPKLAVKTLQQREQEYAEARLRILGSAKNPDENAE